MSNDNNMAIDSDIREEESINLIKKLCQNLKYCKWDQLSMKMKDSICQLQFCLGQIIEKNYKMMDQQSAKNKETQPN